MDKKRGGEGERTGEEKEGGFNCEPGLEILKEEGKFEGERKGREEIGGPVGSTSVYTSRVRYCIRDCEK